jgi:Phage integrase, N-terminal SAM-like domain
MPIPLHLSIKLSDAITGYWLDKRITFSKHTITGYTVVFDRLVAFLNDMEIEQVTPNDVRWFLAYVADEHDLSDKSLANIWITLNSLGLGPGLRSTGGGGIGAGLVGYERGRHGDRTHRKFIAHDTTCSIY